MLAQMRVVPADIEANLKQMNKYINFAKHHRADALVFPEMCVAGYLLGDKWADDEFCFELEQANQVIRQQSDGMLLIWGNLQLDRQRRNRDGRVRKYNALHAYVNQQALKRSSNYGPDFAIKTLQPNYRFFDDDRHFFSLLDLALEEGVGLEQILSPFIWHSRLGPVGLGLEICEDLWSSDYRKDMQELSISRLLRDAGADLIINASASPWTPNKNEARHRHVARTFEHGGIPFLYVNNVGTQNNGKNIITFDGCSAVYGYSGDLVLQAQNAYQEAILTVEYQKKNDSLAGACLTTFEGQELDFGHAQTQHDAQQQSQLRPAANTNDDSLDPASAHFLAALEAIRMFDTLMDSASFPWIIGLSGGVDSAVVACLLQAAVGPKRVIAVNMPSKFNSNTSKGFAKSIAQSLAIELIELPIEALVSANCDSLMQFKPSSFDLENLQAKVRGTSILSNIAAIHGGLMTNNGNKVEFALGYATLYGDVNGALAPIGDLLKTEVFQLARYLNKKAAKAVIPLEILPDEQFNFAFAPSAELRSNQVDPMKWGYHDQLLHALCKFQRFSPEKAIERWLDNSLWDFLEIDPALAKRYQLDHAQIFVDDLEWFMKLFYRGVFKRIQAPPIVVMSRSAFGFDFRESQLPWRPSQRYQLLKKAALDESLHQIVL